jgi:type IV pilus assembly protein PilV
MKLHPANIARLGRLQGGFTLLEILVAIVVLSLGLLGLAGLQAVSLRNNQAAYYRGIASQQAYDMADRIRANLAGVRAGDYDNLNSTTPGIPSPDCFSTACSTANIGNMAITDHAQWNTINGLLLPNGTGTVQCVEGLTAGCTANGQNWTFDITLTWTEKTDTTGAVPQGVGAQTFVTRVSP